MPERETKRFFGAHRLAEEKSYPHKSLGETGGRSLIVRDGIMSTAISE
jgi:hypothetical protein